MHIEGHEKKDEVGIEFNKWLQKETEIYKTNPYPIQNMTSKRTFIETHIQFNDYVTQDFKKPMKFTRKYPMPVVY